MKRILYLLLFFVPFLCSAQNAEIKISNEVHDFGDIKEAAGPVTAVFTFTNTGKSPLILNKVDASCGCTTPDWTKSPVMPGKTGVVKATYDPANRPDRFDKTITIHSNAKENPQIVVRIRGNVIPKTLSVEEQYPFAIGQVRMKRSSIEMSRIMSNASRTETVELINTGKSPAIVSFEKVPAYVQLSASPVSIPAGQKGKITCVVNANKIKDFGPISDPVVMKVNAIRGNLAINAIIDEDFSKLTPEEVKNAPKVEVANTSFTFGKAKKGAKVKVEYPVKNIGKSDLILRKVHSDCNCLENPVTNTIIKAGETTTLSLMLDLKDEKSVGEKFYSISLTTNDPNQRQVYLYAIGSIE